MTLFGSLVFKVANATEQLRAVELRRQVYTEEFGHATGDELDQRAYHLIACNEVDEVVATMRVIGPEQRPFDIEEFVNLAEFIAPGRSVAVTGGLCVRRDCRTVSSQSFISLGLFKLSLAFAHKQGITDFLTYVYPNLREFYRRSYFKVVVPAFEHPAWGTVCLMHLDLVDFEARYSQSQERWARLLFATDLPNIKI